MCLVLSGPEELAVITNCEVMSVLGLTNVDVLYLAALEIGYI